MNVEEAPKNFHMAVNFASWAALLAVVRQVNYIAGEQVSLFEYMIQNTAAETMAGWPEPEEAIAR